MLYLSPLLIRGDQRLRFTYTDNVGLLRTGKDTAATTRALMKDLRDALQWAQENAISFAPDKYELIHFTRRATPRVHRIRVDDLEIHSAVNPVRWLGVYFNLKLGF